MKQNPAPIRTLTFTSTRRLNLSGPARYPLMLPEVRSQESEGETSSDYSLLATAARSRLTFSAPEETFRD
jgi:hypothetical protein